MGRRKKRTFGKEKTERSETRRPAREQKCHRPPGNKHAEKFGFFSRYLPEETLELVGLTADSSPLDLLWAQIQLAFAAIIRAQKIAYVKDQTDKTIEKVEEKDGNVIGERWEIQEAWDKQANFMKAQARAMESLRGLIKQYDDMLRATGEAATEEQRLRLELLRAKLGNGSGEVKKVTIINDTKRQPGSDQ